MFRGYFHLISLVAHYLNALLLIMHHFHLCTQFYSCMCHGLYSPKKPLKIDGCLEKNLEN